MVILLRRLPVGSYNRKICSGNRLSLSFACGPQASPSAPSASLNRLSLQQPPAVMQTFENVKERLIWFVFVYAESA
jgi:hypothetical protein